MSYSKKFSNEPIQGNPWLWVLKSSAMGWWKIFNDLLLPALYAVAGALIYSEIDNALKSSPNSVGEILEKLGGDIMSNPALFIAFMVLLFLWLLTKFRKDPILSELHKMNAKLDKLDIIDKKLDTLIVGGKQDEQSKSENSKPHL